MILKSTDYTYTTYDSQVILLQATPTPSQPIISNDTTNNILHPHNLQYATATNKPISKYMLYSYFALILVTMLNCGFITHELHVVSYELCVGI